VENEVQYESIALDNTLRGFHAAGVSGLHDADAEIEITKVQQQRQRPLSITASLLRRPTPFITIGGLNDVYNTTQQVIDAAYTDTARADLTNYPIITFCVMISHQLSKIQYSNNITVNKQIYELRQIINYNGHISTRSFGSVLTKLDSLHGATWRGFTNLMRSKLVR
jgi:hypothetical protein